MQLPKHVQVAYQHVHRLTASWRAGPKVSVAPSTQALPFPAPDDARGLYWKGEVHLVAGQPAQELAETLVHEAVGHYGLRAMLGAEWPHFLRHIQGGVRSGDEGLIYVQQHIRNTYLDAAGAYMLTPAQEADEIAAYVAENLVCCESGEIRPARPIAQAATALKGRALREAFLLERAVSRSELEGTLLLTAKQLEGWPWHPMRRKVGLAWGTCLSMVGMRNPYKPPMSLRESERLLKAEKDRLDRIEDWKFLGQGFLAIGGLILFVGSIIMYFVFMLG